MGARYALIFAAILAACENEPTKEPRDLEHIDAQLLARQAQALASSLAIGSRALLADSALRDPVLLLDAAQTSVGALASCISFSDDRNPGAKIATLSCDQRDLSFRGALRFATEVSNPGDQIFRFQTLPGSPFLQKDAELFLVSTLYRSTDGARVSLELTQAVRLEDVASAILAKTALVRQGGALLLSGTGVYRDRQGGRDLTMSDLLFPPGRGFPSQGEISIGDIVVTFSTRGADTRITITRPEGTKTFLASELL